MTGETARTDVQDWDIITLSGLKAVANHGVYDFERAGSQDFVADITLFVDARKAAETDDVHHTVDYSQVAEDANKVLAGPAVSLIETLASRLAEMALTYPGVRRVAVTVHKPMAPLKQQFTDVSVTVVRESRGVAGKHAARPQVQERLRPVAPPIPRQRRPRPVDASAPKRVASAPSVLAVTQLEAPKPPSAPTPMAVRTEKKAAAVRKPAAARKPVILQKPTTPQKHARRSVAREKPAYSDPKRPAKVVYKVVLALGANRGDTAANLRGAIEAIANLDGFEMETVSPLVRTKPVLEKGALPQDDYLNAVVLGRTVLAPPALLAATQKIEAEFGRVRTSRWGARTLDIDIISLDRMRLSTRTLTLPHPRAHGRAFVLYPWLLIDAEAYLAGAGYVRDLLPQAEDLPGVIAQYPQWLVGDGAGGLGVEEALELAPRAQEVPRTTHSLPERRVTLRGESVRLASMAGDPIFQELLEAEQPEQPEQPLPSVTPTQPAHPRRTSHAESPALADSATPPREEAAPETEWRQVFASGDASDARGAAQENQPPTTGKIPVVGRSATDTQKFPTRRSMIKTVTDTDTELPEWDFTARSQSPRVVDAVEREERELPPTSQIPKVARNVTMRPTPTGSIPVRRVTDAMTQG